MSRLIGYARVSTTDQILDLQKNQLELAGCSPIYLETASSVKSRPVLEKAITSLKPGDTLMVYKIDRLARSMSDFLRLIERVRMRGAMFSSLTEPIDESTPTGRFLTNILASVAELERSIIVQRTKDGLAAARARGVQLGRAPKLSVADECTLVRRVLRRSITMTQAAREYDVDVSTVKRAIKRFRVANPLWIPESLSDYDAIVKF